MENRTVANQFSVPSLAVDRSGWEANLYADRLPWNLGAKDRERRGEDDQRRPCCAAAVEAAFLESETLRYFPRVLLTRLQADSISKRYEPNQILIERGMSPDCALLLVSGEVRVEEERSATATVIHRAGTLLNPDVLFHPFAQAEQITAKTVVDVASISRASWDSLTAGRPDILLRVENHRVRLLIEEFCNCCPSDAVQKILNADVTVLQERLYAPNQVIYREGDPADYAYLLVSGEVHLARTEEETQCPVNAGECFGHREFREIETRTSGAVARRWTRCLTLSWPAVDAVRAAVGSPGLPLANSIGVSREAPASPGTHEESSTTGVKRPWWIRAINAATRAGEPLILEEDHTQTAMACLRHVGWHYGYRLTDEALLEASRFDTHCPSASALFDWAERIGFRVAHSEAPITDIIRRRQPCIIRCRGGYYMALLPTAWGGYRAASMVDRCWTRIPRDIESRYAGEALFLEPTNQLRRFEASDAFPRRLLETLASVRWLLVEALVGGALLSVFALATPLLGQLVIDRILVEGHVSLLPGVLGVIAALMLLTTGLTHLRQQQLNKVTSKLKSQLGLDVYRHAIRLPFKHFLSGNAGALLARFRDIQIIADLPSGQVGLMSIELLTALVAGSLMVAYDARLAGIALLFIPFYAAVVIVLMPHQQRNSNDAIPLKARLEGLIIESCRAIRSIKEAPAELTAGWSFARVLNDVQAVSNRAARLELIAKVATTLIAVAAGATFLWLGAQRVVEGQLTIGQLFALQYLAFLTAWPIQGLVRVYHQLVESRVALGRLQDFHSLPTEPADRLLVTGSMGEPQGEIVLDAVSFRYSKTRPEALKELSLRIAPRTTVGIVGRSGSGKSTLAMLLQRFFEPTGGRILLDGEDLQGLDLTDVRRRIAIVNQEPELITGTIRENIAVSFPEATDAQIHNAAIAANAHEFVMAFPDGYDTLVGEGGRSVSQGQCQRIAIARALLCQPSVLVLDEATSALDHESEQAISQSLDSLKNSYTILVIAHRLSTIRNADSVVVLEDGQLAEHGSFETLLANGGRLQQMVAAQQDSVPVTPKMPRIEAPQRRTELSDVVVAESPTDASFAADDTPSAGNDVDDAAGLLANMLDRYGARHRDERSDARRPDSVSFFHLSSSFDRCLHDTRLAKATYSELCQHAEPVLVQRKQGGYVVLENADRQAARIWHPSSGSQTLKRDEFERQWSGMALAISPSPYLEETPAERPFDRYRNFMRGQKTLLANVFTFSFLGSLLALAPALAIPFVVDSIAVFDSGTQLHSLLTLLLLAGGLHVLAYFMQESLLIYVGATLRVRLGASLFNHVVRQPISFFARWTTGDILKRFHEIDLIKDIVANKFLYAVVEIARIAACFAAMLIISPLLSIAALVALPIQWLIGRWLKPRQEGNWLDSHGAFPQYQTHLVESFNAITTIKGTAAEPFAIRRFVQMYRRIVALGYEGQQLESLHKAGMTLLDAIPRFLILWFGALLVLAGSMTIGELIAFQGLAMLMLGPLRWLTDLTWEVRGLSLALGTLDDLWRHPPEKMQGQTLAHAEKLRGAVRFENISFGYGSEQRRVLQDIDIEIAPGEVVGLVGASGSGKSTLAKLLVGLFAPTAGRVLIDGIDMRDWDLRSLRSRIGVVSQEKFMFSATVRDNIAIGDPTVALAKVVEAARKAQAHDFIQALPKGYETMLGAGGAGLSGGQRQRICIARALLKDPGLLILDEATAALDTITERAIKELLVEYLPGRTALLIAHQLSTLEHVDRIIVLDEGHVVESGSFDELAKSGGPFSQLLERRTRIHNRRSAGAREEKSSTSRRRPHSSRPAVAQSDMGNVRAIEGVAR